jgi:mono/diheme cytochrome c family protein
MKNPIAKLFVTFTAIAVVGGWVSPAAASEPSTDPAVLFTQLGCIGCHGEGAAFHEEIKGAKGKSVDALARWIRDAPSIDPDTIMPSFKGVLDESRARAVAEWVKARVAAMP